MQLNGHAVVKHLGLVEYLPTWQAMQQFTAARDDATPDEIWILEHPPTYTTGLAGKPEHLPISVSNIPVVHIDRGGQITYHGPGQMVIYLMINLKRRHMGVRELVSHMEQAVIDLLAEFNIISQRQANAPGVYVDGAKVAALGLRIKRGCSYHGLSLNVDMDLTPFYAINPCGYPGMQVTQTKDLGIAAPMAQLGNKLTQRLLNELSYNVANSPSR